ncbi:hypothetical protein O181_009621 [Austropuccinia psidii MF-1]|uniref:Uncharacterized protein n=1 Tax=Austropuccinia psidii MF-1 TaxID=1389203 RepID=A0A9Q3BPL8_9BASI|nr:hypothetical protein [Austropuccinia psidii MF-1]
MSSSNPHKSCSESVNDLNSESSIEYVQTQSPMSPKISLTSPIASSMNVSGLNIDVGNALPQTSSTWTIANIAITPISPNPTKTQMHVSEAPGRTPEISSKANPQSKILHGFLLNIDQNSVESQEPLGKGRQPLINIPSATKVHVGHEKWVDGGQQRRPLGNFTWSGLSEGNPGLMLHQNMEPKGKTIQSQEIIEDHDETNDEPRRDNFTAHEEGTQSNSEFTHPQMPLTQSILDKSEMRQRRDQACKAHSMEKHASQKEQQKWLKVELPANVHEMRSGVHAHCLFLFKVKDKNFSSLPAPPRTEEHKISIKVDGHLGYVPKDVFNEP